MKLNEGREWMPLWSVRWADANGEWHTAKVRAESANDAMERLGRAFPLRVQTIDITATCRI